MKSLAILTLFSTQWVCAQTVVEHPIPSVAKITVDAANADPGTIPRSIFGTFLEPIGNSTYNGLWAEVLENPSFEAGLWSPQNVRQLLQERPELRHSSNLGIPIPGKYSTKSKAIGTNTGTATRPTPIDRLF